jgi:uncharacterized protein
MIELNSHPRGVVLGVKAQAGARKTGILGEHNGLVRIAVSAAPEKGKANQAIIQLLAEALKVPKSSVEIAAGATSPQKRFLICGMSEAELRTILERLLAT